MEDKSASPISKEVITPKWQLPDIKITQRDTVNFCERCKPLGKCLGLKGLSDKAWRESRYFHTAFADEVLKEMQPLAAVTEPAFAHHPMAIV